MALVHTKNTNEEGEIPAVSPGRQGTASLTFTRDPGGKTYISDQYVAYPFHLTRPFYFDADPDGMLSLYLQSASGGIYRDDDLRLELTARAGTAVHVTTQASTIVHDTREGSARQAVHIRVGEGAFLEYLPDPLILFSGAALESRVNVTVEPGATLLIADAFTLHDPKGGDRPFHSLDSSIRIESGEHAPLALDRYRIEGGDLSVGNPALDGGQTCQGALFAIAPAGTRDMISAVRDTLESHADIYAGVSAFADESGLCMRVLSADALSLDRAMKGAWSAIRQTLTGVIPKPRRK